MTLTRDERAEINRQNARKSTGPRTAEGKAAAARNALTHGLTARVFPVLPGEDPAEHESFVAEWVEGYRPASPGRRALVERAADLAWKLRRAGQIDDAHLAHRARQAGDAFEVEQLRRAEALGDLLRVEDPEIVAVDPRGHRRTPRSRPHPAAVGRELETFLDGVRWKLARWGELRALLDDDGFWDHDAKFLAVRLLGVRPEDVMIDLSVRRVFACCNALHPSRESFTNDAFNATLGWPGRSYNKFRAVELNIESPEPREAGATLRALVGSEVARLHDLIPALEERDAIDRAEAPTRALAEAAPGLAPLHRYESALDRALRLAVASLERPDAHSVDTDGPFAFTFTEPAPSPAPAPDVPVAGPPPAEPAPAAEAAASPRPRRKADAAASSAPTPAVGPRRNEAIAPAAPILAPVPGPRNSCWAPPQAEVA